MMTNRVQERTGWNEESKGEDSIDPNLVLNTVDLNPINTGEFYSVENYYNLGEGMLEALLDYFNIHPCSRIPNTPYKNFINLKLHLAHNLMRIIPHRFDNYVR